MIWESIGWLLALAGAAFVQNMAFTWSSRSRNSGDPKYHRKAALSSNGIWLICHLLVWKHVWGAFETGAWLQLGIAAVVYVFATTEGSVAMMRILVRTERGKHRVGARGKQ